MARPIQEASGDPWSMAFVWSNYGEVARANGDFAQAEEFYRQTAEYYEIADAKGDQARLVCVFGYLALHKGNYAEASQLFHESLEDFIELGNQRGIAECLAGLAVLFVEQEHFARGATLLSAADRQLKEFGGAWWPADRVEIDRGRTQMKKALGDQFADRWSEGQAMGVKEAITFASPVE
jgi:tetratricopeptide (TPR) repeat protein